MNKFDIEIGELYKPKLNKSHFNYLILYQNKIKIDFDGNKIFPYGTNNGYNIFNAAKESDILMCLDNSKYYYRDYLGKIIYEISYFKLYHMNHNKIVWFGIPENKYMDLIKC